MYVTEHAYFQVHDLADRGYLTPEQLHNLSSMRRSDPMGASGGAAGGSSAGYGGASSISGASKIVEANRLASNINNPADLREALKLLFSITSHDVTASSTSSVEEQLLHYNQQVNCQLQLLSLEGAFGKSARLSLFWRLQ